MSARQAEAVAADQARRAVALGEDEGPYPVPVRRAVGEHVLGLDAREPHLVRAVAEAVADLRILELGQHTVALCMSRPSRFSIQS